MSDTEYYCTCGYHHACNKRDIGYCIHPSASTRCNCQDICGKAWCNCIISRQSFIDQKHHTHHTHHTHHDTHRDHNADQSRQLQEEIETQHAPPVFCASKACFNPGILIKNNKILCQSCSDTTNDQPNAISIFGCSLCGKTHQKYYLLSTKKLICASCKSLLSKSKLFS